MASENDSAEIKETDIVFDCPHCGKSLAIDYRGAGLTIPCTDCGKNVEVPIPDGMEVTDLDSSDEEQEVRILHLRKALAAAHEKISGLDSEIDALNDRRENLEKIRSNNLYRMGAILERVGTIQKSIQEINDALKGITELAEARD